MDLRGGSRQPAAAAPVQSTVSLSNGGKKKKKGMVFGTFLILVPIALLIAAVVVLMSFSDRKIPTTVKKNQYQAVFLSGGQAYFGKITSLSKDYLTLEDIYYLRADTAPQPDTKNQSSSQPQITLQRLGSELHAPESKMVIRTDQVLFWENIQDSGKVVDAIKRDKSGQTNTTTTTPTTTTPAQK